MKKVLVLAAMAVFSSLYTDIWGGVYTSGDCTVTVSGSTITVSGTGAMADCSENGSAWYNDRRTLVKEVRIEEGVTYIAKNAFNNATALRKVTIPTSVVSIGKDAFKGNTSIDTLVYAGSPNQWANVSIANSKAHPLQTSGFFYFFGNTKTTRLVLMPPLTEVKKLAFYHGKFQDVHIPGTVAYIRDSAFYGSFTEGSGQHVVINRKTAPTFGAKPFPNVSKTLYIPAGATGYTISDLSLWTKTGKAVSGTLGADFGSDITWSLDEYGTLTLNATGANKIISFVNANSYNDYKWSYFRRLVYKVILKGEISELTETLTWCYGLAEVELQQSTIPTVSPTGTNNAISFNSRFDKSSNVVLKVKPAALVSASASNLDAAPWNNEKLSVALSETATFFERAENTDTLEAIKTYIDLPFSLQLKRSLSNAYYNTFCSPIPISAEQIVSTWGDDTYAHGFEGTEYDEGKDSLTLHFTEEIASIAAGVPYLIQPENNVANPTFTNVVPSTIVTEPATITPDDAAASFVGTILSENVTEEWAEAENFIFLKADNKLTFATTGTLRGMRAYFLLDKDVSASALAKAPGLRIGHSEHIATATEHIPHDAAHNASKIIRNGQLVIVRDGVEYNAQGIRIN